MKQISATPAGLPHSVSRGVPNGIFGGFQPKIGDAAKCSGITAAKSWDNSPPVGEF